MDGNLKSHSVCHWRIPNWFLVARWCQLEARIVLEIVETELKEACWRKKFIVQPPNQQIQCTNIFSNKLFVQAQLTLQIHFSRRKKSNFDFIRNAIVIKNSDFVYYCFSYRKKCEVIGNEKNIRVSRQNMLRRNVGVIFWLLLKRTENCCIERSRIRIDDC